MSEGPPQPNSISGKTRLLGVAGWPVDHSKSPQLHNAALRAAGLDFVYVPFPIPPDRFEIAVRGLAAAGLIGLNCTIPHKYAAYAICDEMSDIAKMAGTVNTLHFRPEGIYGTNTDVEGYVESLRQDGGFDFQNCSVVQFGAGGAGRGMALGALSAGAKRLTIINRTVEKAESLVRDLQVLYPNAIISVLSSEKDALLVQEAIAHADLLANATSLGLRDSDPFPCDAKDIPKTATVFDAAYTAQGSTAWLRAAAEKGCRILDGMGMLVRQGAASFKLWTGVEPDLSVMFGSLAQILVGI